MSNDNDDVGLSQKSANSERKQCTTIFSKEEIESTVKGFLLALIRGQITINFKTAEEFIAEAKVDGKRLTFEEAHQEEVDTKGGICDLIDICNGAKHAKMEEVEKTKYGLFNVIIRLRMAQRIEGKFYGIEIEERIDRLEEGLSKTNRVLEEFVIWLKQVSLK